jgi:allantoinase
MDERTLALRSRRVILPDGSGPATVAVVGGRIEAVAPWSEPPGDRPLVDLGDDVLMAGLVDAHVHVNDPGRADWEGFRCATRAAAAGGVTTLVDMPLNSRPPTTTPDGLAAKAAAARGNLWVDVGLWGGVVPGNQGHLRALWEGGVLGFKAFLAPSGVDEFPAVGAADLAAALAILGPLGAPLLVHAELPEHLDAGWGERTDAAGRRRHAAHLAARPPAAEVAAIELVARLAGRAGARVHVVHVSSAEALPAVRRARRDGVALTAETCPHYLAHHAAAIADGETLWKCAPPIREAAHREALWGGLLEGDLDLVASDHSPSPPAGKCLDSGDFAAAWGGISSLQLLLPAVWTEARRRGIGLERVARWLAAAPARLAGLGRRKGAIEPGLAADLVAWDPEATFTVDPERLYHRHRLTPWAGRELAGVVRRTFLGGAEVYDGRAPGEAARGELLRR